mmetsp:Transcript_56070/g.103770  ORF Transcript_56070/g.103770 Transcript_56070/m.103770 type:complete len:164 (+) Transcript_56070:62-553(+)
MVESSICRRRYQLRVCIAVFLWLCASCRQAMSGHKAASTGTNFVAPLPRLSVLEPSLRMRQLHRIGRHSEPELKPALRGVPEAPSIEDDAQEDTILVYLLGGGIVCTGAGIGFIATQNLTETSYFLPVIVCLGFSLAFTLGFGALLGMKTQEKESKVKAADQP